MKSVLITGATDGIGLETAKMFAQEGHKLLLHGRSLTKLEKVKNTLLELNVNLEISLHVADFASLADVLSMADTILIEQTHLDVLINNAGVFVVDEAQVITKDDLDIRFQVNTIAPYFLTKKLLPILGTESRVINLASAAQAPLNFKALINTQRLSTDHAYAQSKLALIMWSMEMAKNYPQGPLFIAVNPKSFLGSKMVKQAYGQQGYDLKIGAQILHTIALNDAFKNAGGKYFDNDYGQFAMPHSFAQQEENRVVLMGILEEMYGKNL